MGIGKHITDTELAVCANQSGDTQGAKMIKYMLQDVMVNKPDIDMATVESHEMNIYILRLTIEGKQRVVHDKLTQRPKAFRSIEQVRAILGGCNVARAELIHRSPFDEMIGNSQSKNNMVLPFSIHSRV